MFQDRLVQCIGIVLSSSKDTVIIIYHWQDSMVACDRAQKCRLIFWLKLPFIATSHFGRSELLMSFQPIHMCLCRFAICLSRANIIYIYMLFFNVFYTWILQICSFFPWKRRNLYTQKEDPGIYKSPPVMAPTIPSAEWFHSSWQGWKSMVTVDGSEILGCRKDLLNNIKTGINYLSTD